MSIYKYHTDQQLLVLLKDRDHRAYTEIYDRYWAMLFRHARKMLADDEEAADVIQDIFTTMWIKASEWHIHTNLSSYLYTAVRHHVLTRITKSKLKKAHLNSLADFVNTGVNFTDAYLEVKELSENIESEINHLPKKMREIFQLSRKEELSYREIAEKLDVSDHTVRKQISNALKILKNKIQFLFF